MKELKIDHSEIDNPQTITRVMEQKFHDAGLDVSKHEVLSLEDDMDRKTRHIKVKTSKTTIFVGDIPWHRDAKGIPESKSVNGKEG